MTQSELLKRALGRKALHQGEVLSARYLFTVQCCGLSSAFPVYRRGPMVVTFKWRCGAYFS